MVEKKVCTKCQLEKLLGEFYQKRNGSFQSWCKSCFSEYAKARLPDVKQCYYDRNKQWRQNNPDWIKKYNSSPEMKIKRRQWKRNWDRKAMQDPLHRLSNNVRGNMHHALKAKKAGRKWEELVGYTLEDLIKHLESQFTGSIVWENYGTHWHVDHITPKSWFNYTSTEAPQFKECWALTNLQPKLKMDNIRKGNRSAG